MRAVACWIVASCWIIIALLGLDLLFGALNSSVWPWLCAQTRSFGIVKWLRMNMVGIVEI